MNSYTMATSRSDLTDGNSISYKFENLPDVILLKIFGLLHVGDLCKAGRVCLRWYNLARSSIFWKYVDAHEMQLSSYQIQKFVPILPPCVTYLRIRSLSTQHRVPFLTPQVAIEIRERCPQLKTLIIESAFIAKHVHFTDITVEDLPEKLSVLSLRKSFFHADQFFCSISHPTIPKIKVLDCSACWCVKDYDIPFFTRLSDLQELYLSSCPISDIGITVLLKITENLRVLDLEATLISDSTVALITERSRFLEKLFLGSTIVSDRPWTLLPHCALPKLNSLCLASSSVSAVGLRSILLTFHNLKYLDIRHCNVPYDSALELSCLVPVKRNFRFIYGNCNSLFTCTKFCDHFLERVNLCKE